MADGFTGGDCCPTVRGELLDCCARQAKQDTDAMCDATRQALLAILMA